MRSGFYGHRFALFALATGFAMGLSGQATGEIKKITVTSSTDIGQFRGKSYREVRATMDGAAPGGAYSVPVVLAFPVAATDYNGFAVIDVVNTVTVGDADFVAGGRVYDVARLHMGEDYLFGNGNYYVGVLWDKAAAELLQTGKIGAPSDGYEILRDAARLARAPAEVPFSSDAVPPRGADQVVAYGFSQSAGLLRGWYFRRLNTQKGDPTFDGALIAGAGGYCMELMAQKDANWAQCGGALADGGKVIVISTEGDVEWTGFVERGETADYRVIEIAGVSHIPAALVDFRKLGLPNQNPIDGLPVFRAALTNLQAWLRGTTPPPSIHITLKEGPAGDLFGDPFREAARDGDGNALGGVRLPHMPTMSEGSKIAGAPLGTYDGLNLEFKDKNRYFLSGGAFTPFPQDKIRALYADHAAYVSAVKLAADDLVAQRYILPEDANAYIEAAKRSDIGQ
jgi:Alpha/beta hydrolase domain